MPSDTNLTLAQISPLCSEFSLEKKVGQGGQKQVFRGSDADGTKVVVKVVRIDYIWVDNTTVMRDADAEIRARREIDLMRRYSSPHLPCLYDYRPKDVEIDGLTYILYVENDAGDKSVADIITADGELKEPAVRKMLRDVATALNLYQTDKIIHRDVKPQNIVHNEVDDSYVLIDGGVHLAPYNTTISNGYIPGTEPYYSPEQASGNRRTLDSRSDLFALGISAYEALTGKNPFAISATNMAEFNHNRANALYPPLAPSFAEETRNIVHKLLQRYPHNRYRNPSVLLLELEEED